MPRPPGAFRSAIKLRSLDSHASRTRCKLRDAGAVGFIVNCHTHGYKLTDDHAAVRVPTRP
jgi:hypothetical protein